MESYDVLLSIHFLVKCRIYSHPHSYDTIVINKITHLYRFFHA